MSVLVCTLQGRMGNQVMQWLFTYAFALQNGMEFQCPEWIGERIFDVPEYKRPWSGAAMRRVNEHEIWNLRGTGEDIEFRGYAQCQSAMIYTKRQAQAWLKLRPEIETAAANAVLASPLRDARVVCHHRVGDYAGYGYPIVSLESYQRACDQFGINWVDGFTAILSEELPIRHEGHLQEDLSFMPDFYRMMTAPTLLRGNSSFSWLAALLGDGLVLSPIVDGLEGGKEHHCRFVAGNWPKFAPHLDFVTDLHVAP